MQKARLNSGEQLQRKGEASQPSIANLIVIGASAGGHKAVLEILKSLSADTPTAIVILLHAALGCTPFLKESLGRYSRLPIIEVEDREPLAARVHFRFSAGQFLPNPKHSRHFTSPAHRELTTGMNRLRSRLDELKRR